MSFLSAPCPSASPTPHRPPLTQSHQDTTQKKQEGAGAARRHRTCSLTVLLHTFLFKRQTPLLAQTGPHGHECVNHTHRAKERQAARQNMHCFIALELIPPLPPARSFVRLSHFRKKRRGWELKKKKTKTKQNKTRKTKLRAWLYISPPASLSSQLTTATSLSPPPFLSSPLGLSCSRRWRRRHHN